MRRLGLRLPGSGVWTGGVNYLVTVCRALLLHPESGYEPVVFYHPDTDPEVLEPFRQLLGDRLVGDSRVPSPRSRAGMAGAIFRGRNEAMQSLCESHRCDIVFEAADYLGWRFSRACLVWVPDFQDRHLPELFPRWGRYRRSLGLRLQLLSGRTVLLSSEDARNDCETYYPGSKGRTAVARFAVKPPLKPGEADPTVASTHGLPSRFFYLPNQYWRHKNHARVIEALALLRDRNQSVVVASSGNPSDPRHTDHYSYLKSMVADKGVEQNFLFLGNVPGNHVAVLMRSAIAVLNPSLFEGWSTTVEEAKSIGARLVLSNLRVHREQTRSKADYFDPLDPVEIASALERVWQANAAPPSVEQQQAATEDADARVREFAMQFASACDQAIVRFRRRA